MPTSRWGLGVAVVNGRIYAIGGRNESGYLATNEEYDPATNTWTTKKPMQTPRAGFGIAVCQNKIYVIGGISGIDPSTGISICCSLNEVYDPLTDSWETKTSMPTNRSLLNAHVVNGKIYLIGGYYMLDPQTPLALNVNEVYDPITDTWTTKASIPTAVFAYASAVVNNKIYVIERTTQIYDPETDTWNFGKPIPTMVAYAAAGATTGISAPKRIYVIGGAILELPIPWDPINLNQVYDPEKDVWTTGDPIPTRRREFGVAVVNDVLYAIGGSTGGKGPSTSKNEQYTPFGFGTVPPPDTTTPTIFIVSPENKTYTVTDVPLTFTVSEPTSWIGYSLDEQANVTIAENTTLTGLLDGFHSLIVYATDTAGNTGTSEKIYFTIKTQQSQPFPSTWIVAAIVAIAAVGAVLRVYLAKIKKTENNISNMDINTTYTLSAYSRYSYLQNKTAQNIKPLAIRA